MAPEIELMMMIGGSALMFHMSKSLFNNSNFNINDVLKNNPDLMKSLMTQMQTGGSSIQTGGSSSQTPVGESFNSNQGVVNRNNLQRVPPEVIDDISDRISEASFASDMTGIKSVNIRLDTVKGKANTSANGKKQKKVLDIGM